ncbi:Barwin-related endoglucanase [Penicillium sp. DV-2018c]|nr:Barwin-related endoglucanase [Penicillium sp. DV-2018c]
MLATTIHKGAAMAMIAVLSIGAAGAAVQIPESADHPIGWPGSNSIQGPKVAKSSVDIQANHDGWYDGWQEGAREDDRNGWQVADHPIGWPGSDSIQGPKVAKRSVDIQADHDGCQHRDLFICIAGLIPAVSSADHPIGWPGSDRIQGPKVAKRSVDIQADHDGWYDGWQEGAREDDRNGWQEGTREDDRNGWQAADHPIGWPGSDRIQGPKVAKRSVDIQADQDGWYDGWREGDRNGWRAHGTKTYGGDLTWFNTGLGGCGWYNQPSDAICAVSHIVYDRMNVDSNPNHNQLCGRKIRIKRGDREIDVTVADRCEGCKEFDIDVTTGVFEKLGSLKEGRVHIDWWWI